MQIATVSNLLSAAPPVSGSIANPTNATLSLASLFDFGFTPFLNALLSSNPGAATDSEQLQADTSSTQQSGAEPNREGPPAASVLAAIFAPQPAVVVEMAPQSAVPEVPENAQDNVQSGLFAAPASAEEAAVAASAVPAPNASDAASDAAEPLLLNKEDKDEEHPTAEKFVSSMPVLVEAVAPQPAPPVPSNANPAKQMIAPDLQSRAQAAPVPQTAAPQPQAPAGEMAFALRLTEQTATRAEEPAVKTETPRASDSKSAAAPATPSQDAALPAASARSGKDAGESNADHGAQSKAAEASAKKAAKPAPQPAAPVERKAEADAPVQAPRAAAHPAAHTAAMAASAAGAVDAPQRTTEARGTEAAPKTVAAAETDVAVAEKPKLTQNNQLSIKLDRPGEKQVTMQVTERAGQLHVAVRSDDARLNSALGTDLNDLVSNLEQHGFKTESWTPSETVRPVAQSMQSEMNSTGEEASREGGQHRQQQQQQRNNQQQEQPEWVEEFDTTFGSAAQLH